MTIDDISHLKITKFGIMALTRSYSRPKLGNPLRRFRITIAWIHPVHICVAA